MRKAISSQIVELLLQRPEKAYSVPEMQEALGLRKTEIIGGLGQLAVLESTMVRKIRSGVWKAADGQGSAQSPARSPSKTTQESQVLGKGELLEVVDSPETGEYVIAVSESGKRWAVLEPDEAHESMALALLTKSMMRIIMDKLPKVTPTPPIKSIVAKPAKPAACRTGGRLAQLRMTHGYETREDLEARIRRVAPKSKMDAQTLRRLEDGKRPLYRDEIVELARAFGVSASDLDACLHLERLYSWE